MERDRLVLHEAHDEDRLNRLRARIEAEGEQRNPVVVAPCGGAMERDCYLVLDGAHRTRALGEIGCGFVLVQLVEPPKRSESWAHLLGNFGARWLHAMEGVAPADGPDGALAEVNTGEETVYLRSRQDGLAGQVRALWALQALYPPDRGVRRVEPNGIPVLGEDEALIHYRTFTPDELFEVVRSGEVLPAGITRFRVQERILGVRYPLSKMRDGDPDDRNSELQTFVRERWEENRVRYYNEPVVLFE